MYATKKMGGKQIIQVYGLHFLDACAMVNDVSFTYHPKAIFS